MKFSFITILGIILLSLVFVISAQTVVPSQPSQDNAKVLCALDQQAAGLQAQVDQLAHFKTQSQRIAYYTALHNLAVLKATYYNLLAIEDPDRGYIARQTAWRFNQKAVGLQAKLYSLADASPPVAQHIGKMRF